MNISESDEVAEGSRESFWIGSGEFGSAPPKSDVERSHTLHRVKEIDEHQYFEILKAIEEATQYVLRDEHSVVVENFRNYLKAARESSSALAAYPADQHALRDESIGLRIWLFDWLLSIRAFLDHSRTRLARRFGPDSPELSRFATACSKEFDDHFSYRFMYKLRDYSQHCGFPPANLTVSHRQGHDARVDLSLEREVLLSDFDEWGPHVEPDLQRQAPRIPVEPLMRGMMDSIHRIDATLREIEKERFERSSKVIEDARMIAGQHSGTPLVMAQTEDQEGNLLEIRVHDILGWLRRWTAPSRVEGIPIRYKTGVHYDTGLEDSTARWAFDAAIALVKTRLFGSDDPAERFIPTLMRELSPRLSEEGVSARDAERVMRHVLPLTMAFCTFVKFALTGWSDCTDPDRAKLASPEKPVDLATLLEGIRLAGERASRIW